MSIQFEAIKPEIGARVTGVDLTKPLTREQAAQIEAAMDRYAMLVFHKQYVSDEQQKSFTVNFGPIENARGGNITKPEDKRLADGLNDVSNLGKDGKPLREGQPAAPVQHRQYAVALGQLLPRHSGQVFDSVGARRQSGRRQHGIREHEGRL